MELGGNIILEGFDNTKPEQMIVIKKIAGSFAKKVSETQGEYEKVILYLENNYKIKIQVKFKDKELVAENEDKNLFFALTNSIKEIESQF